jgi:heme A synthase
LSVAGEAVGMVSEAVDIALLVAYLALLAAVAVQYYRGVIPRQRLTMLVGLCCTWLAYGLLQLTDGGPLPSAGPLNLALNGLSVVLLVVGLYLLYRWYRRRESGDESPEPGD